MLIRRLVFRPIGLIGCAVFAHGVHGLLVRAECGRVLHTCGVSDRYLTELLVGLIMALLGLIFSGIFVIGALLIAAGIGIMMGVSDPAATEPFRLLYRVTGGVLVAAGVGVSVIAGWAYWLRWTRTVRARASSPAVATVTRFDQTPRQLNYTVAHRGVFANDRAEGAAHRAAVARGAPQPGLAIRRLLRGTAHLFDPVDHSEYEVVAPTAAPAPAAAPAAPAPAPAGAAAPATAPDALRPNLVDELERLAKLQASGGLTATEYARLKERLIRR